MKVSAVASSAIFAGAVLASTNGPDGKPWPEKFNILALRSASAIHDSWVEATKNSLLLKYGHQGATCTNAQGPPGGDKATFVLKDSKLSLFAINNAQRVVVDISNTATQGALTYIQADAALPPHTQETGWNVDKDGNLLFGNSNLLACPGAIDGSWKVQVSLGDASSADLKNCLGFTARINKNDNPPSCQYN